MMRTYDPQTGRYLEPDPIGFQGGSLNLYAYVEGNPLSRIDPRGLFGGDPWDDVFPGVDPTPSPSPGPAFEPQFGPPSPLNVAVPAIAAASGQVGRTMFFSCFGTLAGGPVSGLSGQQVRSVTAAGLAGLAQAQGVAQKLPSMASWAPASQIARITQQMRAQAAAQRALQNPRIQPPGIPRPLAIGGAAMGGDVCDPCRRP